MTTLEGPRESTGSSDLVVLDALGPDGSYRARRTELVRDSAGVAVAQLSLVPPLFVGRAVDAQRKVRPLPREQRQRIVNEAARGFVHSTIAGMTFPRYVELAARVSGLPVSISADGAREVPRQCRGASASILAAQPRGAVLDWRDQPTRTGGAVWSRRGDVYGVHAAGNAVALLGFWVDALLLGYRVAIRPSRREPFTVHRLVLALREAGLRPEDAVYLPTDYAGADELIRAADLSMVYGGQDVVDKYATNPAVFTNGPGRTKILITAEQDWRDYLDVIVDSICSHGGMGCTNATAVLCEGDAAALAEAIAQRLAGIKALPPTDPDAVLPTQPSPRARALAEHLARRAHGATPLLGADQVVVEVGDGQCALRPAVHLLAHPNLEQLNTELPFPCVWVSPWSRSDGLAPLRNSLVLNAITTDERLLDALLDEPTITNVYGGHHRTDYATPEIPHDGYPADFLMRNKGFIRD
jgi:acyl-CoA reductase-like NAD-dependent aldehyde dehydrogenase